MIDFRYHLVSIVAVFLALGLGLLLGATALSSKVANALRQQSSFEEKKITKDNNQITGYQQLIATGEPVLLAHLLTGEHVVLVTAPGADPNAISGITAAILKAGGSVAGQVTLQDQLFDTSAGGRSTLRQLTLNLAPHVDPAGQPLRPGSPVAQAGQVLADALVTKDGLGQPTAGQPTTASRLVLNGFKTGGYVSLSGNMPGYANLAVMVAPASPASTSEGDPLTSGPVALARQFERAGQGTVVAGSTFASGPGSVIDSLRVGGTDNGPSTVDFSDNVTLGAEVVWVLCKELRGIHGNYGLLPSANSGAAPSPAPTPSPTPTDPPTQPVSSPSDSPSHSHPSKTGQG